MEAKTEVCICITCGEQINLSDGREAILYYCCKTKKMQHEYRYKHCYEKRQNRWFRRLMRKIDDISEKL